MVHFPDDHMAAQFEVLLDLHDLSAKVGSLGVLPIKDDLQKSLLSSLNLRQEVHHILDGLHTCFEFLELRLMLSCFAWARRVIFHRS